MAGRFIVLLETLSAARDLARLQMIASILIRHGFGDIVQRLGMGEALSRAGRVLRWERTEELTRLEPARRYRRALEEMGPTFIKLGQILATRIDLLPPDWIAELERLQDQAPPVPFEKLRPQLETDLGAPPEQIFSDLNTESLAAASIAQVHRARLVDGSPVVIKIRRPGIRPIIEADLRLLGRLAEIAEREIPLLARLRPREVLHQFAQSLRRELDLAGECHNAERVAHNLAGLSGIKVPRVYWEWTGERINVQEYIEGIAGRDMEALRIARLDRRALAVTGAEAVFKMVIQDGFFHADPHPGNVFFLRDNRIALVDFGLMGYLSQNRREQVLSLIHGLVERDSGRVVDILLDWSDLDDAANTTLGHDVEMFINRYHSVALQRLNLAAMLLDLSALIRHNELHLPADLALMFKTFVLLEGLGRQLDPDFDMVAVARPLVREAILGRYAPDMLVRRGWRGLAETLDLLSGFPQELRRVLRSVRRGALQIHIDIDRLEGLAERLDRAISRLTVGLVTAAFIIGTAIVMHAGGGEPWLRHLGYVGAIVCGIWVLWSIWRGK